MSKLKDFFSGGQVDRSYAELDPQSKAAVQTAFDSAQESPESIAAKQIQQAQGAESLLSTPEQMQSQDVRLGMGGQEAFNQAIASRSQDVFGRDMERMKLQSKLGGFDTASGRMQTAGGRSGVQDAVTQGAAQRRAEYDLTRQQMRQQAVNSIFGTVATIAGHAMGGMGGGAAAGAAAKPKGMELTPAKSGMLGSNFSETGGRNA